MGGSESEMEAMCCIGSVKSGPKWLEQGLARGMMV